MPFSESASSLSDERSFATCPLLSYAKAFDCFHYTQMCGICQGVSADFAIFVILHRFSCVQFLTVFFRLCFFLICPLIFEILGQAAIPVILFLIFRPLSFRLHRIPVCKIALTTVYQKYCNLQTSVLLSANLKKRLLKSARFEKTM